MELADIFEPASCSTNMTAKNKESAIEALAALAVRSPKLGKGKEKEIAVALAERESQGSTGFGEELAIPHARVSGMDDFIVFVAHAPRGVDFDSLDKKKVKLFFVILGPDNRPSEHVQILAAISRAMSTTTLKQELLGARSSEVMAESLIRHTGEKSHEHPVSKMEMKLLILILYLDEFIYHILEYFLEEGLEGATILDSRGMGQYISNVPLFATFIGFMNEQKNRSSTIMVTIPAEREEEIIKGIEAITGDLDKKQGAMLMTLDIGTYKGTMKMM